jgi:hypothetical protein
MCSLERTRPRNTPDRLSRFWICSVAHQFLSVSRRGARKTLIAAWAAAVVFAGSPAPAQEPSPDSAAQAAREKAVDALKRNDATALFAAMDEFRELAESGVKVPAGLYFAEADSARSRGDPVRAERAFNDYFEVAAPEGAAFAEAMRSYNEFRQGIPESTWAILQDMTPIPGGVLRSSTGRTEATIAPFTIARQPVTRQQFQEFLDATGREMRPQETADCDLDADNPSAGDGASTANLLVCVSWTDASAYVAWLGSTSGVAFRLPRAAEWEYAVTPLDLPPILLSRLSEWAADCAVPAAVQLPADQTCRERVLMQSPLQDAAPDLQYARRLGRGEEFRSRLVGFRLALGQ